MFYSQVPLNVLQAGSAQCSTARIRSMFYRNFAFTQPSELLLNLQKYVNQELVGSTARYRLDNTNYVHMIPRYAIMLNPCIVLCEQAQMGCPGPGERHNRWYIYHHDRWGAVDLVKYMDGAISSRQMGCRGPGKRHNEWRLYHHDRWGAVDLVNGTMDGAYIITTDGVLWTWWTSPWMVLISS